MAKRASMFRWALIWQRIAFPRSTKNTSLRFPVFETSQERVMELAIKWLEIYLWPRVLFYFSGMYNLSCCHLYTMSSSEPLTVPRRIERINACIATCFVVVGPCCNLQVRKGDKHTKLFLSSLTHKFIRCYTFYAGLREREKKQRIKTELPASAGLWETTFHDEGKREQTQTLKLLSGFVLQL